MIIRREEMVQSQGIAQDSMGRSWGTQRQKTAVFHNKWQYRENAKALISLLLGVVRYWIPLPSNPRVTGSNPVGGIDKSRNASCRWHTVAERWNGIP